MVLSFFMSLALVKEEREPEPEPKTLVKEEWEPSLSQGSFLGKTGSRAEPSWLEGSSLSWLQARAARLSLLPCYPDYCSCGPIVLPCNP